MLQGDDQLLSSGEEHLASGVPRDDHDAGIREVVKWLQVGVRSLSSLHWGKFRFSRQNQGPGLGGHAATKLLLPVVFLVSTQIVNGQGLRQALELRLGRLSAKSRSAVMLWDLPKNEPLAAVRAEVFATPRSLGSLVKPFLLLAYLNERCSGLASNLSEALPCPSEDSASAVPAPLQPCAGRATPQCPVVCWYKPGHGSLGLIRALAVSCNQFFYQLSKHTSPEALLNTMAALGVHTSGDLGGAAPLPPETMIGLDSNLRLVPLQVLKAYATLIFGVPYGRAGDFASSALARTILLSGLRLGAAEGTSTLAQRELPPHHFLLGKTGTSPALRAGRYLRSMTDGWFLGFYPAAQPVLAIVVYYPGGLGAKEAAPLGGQVIRMYLEMLR